MKRPVLAILLLALAFHASASASLTSRSPIGSWEIAWGGRNPGFGFMTFNGDFTVTGYGMALQDFGMFILSGTWTMDTRGNITGSYTEILNNNSITGSFMARATAGRRIIAKAISVYGTRNLTGIPAGYVPDVSGHWYAWVKEGSAIRETGESIDVVPSTEFPAMFGFTGVAGGPSGSFNVDGYFIVTSRGKVILLGESIFSNGSKMHSSVKGSFNLIRQTAVLSGTTDYGTRLRVKVSR